MIIEVTRFNSFYVDSVFVSRDDLKTIADYAEIYKEVGGKFTPACWKVTPEQVKAGKIYFLGGEK
jgi:hypothetical protein